MPHRSLQRKTRQTCIFSKAASAFYERNKTRRVSQFEWKLGTWEGKIPPQAIFPLTNVMLSPHSLNQKCDPQPPVPPSRYSKTSVFLQTQPEPTFTFPNCWCCWKAAMSSSAHWIFSGEGENCCWTTAIWFGWITCLPAKRWVTQEP